MIVTQGSMFCLLLTVAHKFMMSGQPITTDEYCLYSHNMSCTYGMWNAVVIFNMGLGISSCGMNIYLFHATLDSWYHTCRMTFQFNDNSQ